MDLMLLEPMSYSSADLEEPFNRSNVFIVEIKEVLERYPILKLFYFDYMSNIKGIDVASVLNKMYLELGDEVCRNTMMHCFIETRENKYKDIRGTTDSKKRIYDGFEDWDICNELTFNRLEDFKNWFNLFTKR